MSTNYNLCVTQIANITAISSNILVNGDGNFGPIFPAAIDYAEQRIQRELDLMATSVTDATVLTSSGIRSITLSTASGTYLVVEQVNIITPANTTATNGTRSPCTRVTREWLDNVWPQSAAYTAQPTYWSQINPTDIEFGPTPDAAYYVETIGTQRFTPLSASNSSTFLTQNLPDLFNAALMVFMSAQMRDFGSQSDNPQLAQSWENTFQLLVKSATVEEIKKQHRSEGWTSETPSPLATPPRV